MCRSLYSCAAGDRGEAHVVRHAHVPAGPCSSRPINGTPVTRENKMTAARPGARESSCLSKRLSGAHVHARQLWFTLDCLTTTDRRAIMTWKLMLRLGPELDPRQFHPAHRCEAAPADGEEREDDERESTRPMARRSVEREGEIGSAMTCGKVKGYDRVWPVPEHGERLDRTCNQHGFCWTGLQPPGTSLNLTMRDTKPAPPLASTLTTALYSPPVRGRKKREKVGGASAPTASSKAILPQRHQACFSAPSITTFETFADPQPGGPGQASCREAGLPVRHITVDWRSSLGYPATGPVTLAFRCPAPGRILIRLGLAVFDPLPPFNTSPIQPDSCCSTARRTWILHCCSKAGSALNMLPP
nr:hypothetical protein CFP56_38927 [Quercus suber]